MRTTWRGRGGPASSSRPFRFAPPRRHCSREETERKPFDHEPNDLFLARQGQLQRPERTTPRDRTFSCVAPLQLRVPHGGVHRARHTRRRRTGRVASHRRLAAPFPRTSPSCGGRQHHRYRCRSTRIDATQPRTAAVTERRRAPTGTSSSRSSGRTVRRCSAFSCAGRGSASLQLRGTGYRSPPCRSSADHYSSRVPCGSCCRLCCGC